MIKRLIAFTTVLSVLLMPVLCAAQEAEEEYKIKFGVGETQVKIKKMSGDRWTARIGDDKYVLQAEGKGKYEYKWPGGKLEGRWKSDKFKLKKGEDDFLELKFYPDKLKMIRQDSSTQWEIKFKDDRLKVEENDREIGKVHYYPDTGKLKAKDNAGVEVAQMKDSGRLRAVVAPFLLEDAVPIEQRIFWVLLFFTLDK